MKHAQRHNRPWSGRDLATLKAKARQRASAREAAKTLRRSCGAVRYKAMVEGVTFRSINQKPGVQRRPKQRRLLSKLRRARS